MRKTLWILWVSTILFVVPIQTVLALQKAYSWNISSGVGGFNTYQVSIISSDNWQVDTTEEISFRLTLTSKQSVLEKTETNWVRITLSTANFIEDSGIQSETVTLTNIGDYWEKKIPFNIPSYKLSRGTTLNTSVTVVINIDEFDTIQHRSWEHTGQNYDNPMFIGITRPYLSTVELIVVAVVLIAMVGFGTYIIYRRSRRPAQPQSASTQ